MYIRARKHREDKWQSPRIAESSTCQTYFKIADSSPGPRTQIGELERNKNLFRYVDTRDQKFSKVLMLRYIDGLTRKQIAELLDIPENTVKSRLRIALDKIRSIMTMTSC